MLGDCLAGRWIEVGKEERGSVPSVGSDKLDKR
jgi:hypothetical protein